MLGKKQRYFYYIASSNRITFIAYLFIIHINFFIIFIYCFAAAFISLQSLKNFLNFYSSGIISIHFRIEANPAVTFS